GARRGDEPDVRATRRGLRAWLLLALDVVALLTFVPAVSDLLGDAGWLRLLRFGRLLLLVAYWSPLFRLGLEVLGRQDRFRQIGLLLLVTLLVAFAGAALLVHIPVSSVDFDGSGALDEADAGFAARFWWAFRSLADNGNMLADPNEMAVVIVSLGLTVAGLVFVSFLIGIATDIVKELVIAAGNRAPGWHGHTVIVHATPGLPRLVTELGAYYARLFRRPRFVVADVLPEPPDGFRGAEMPRFRWRTLDPRGTELVDKTDLARARRVVVLARPEAAYPDAHLAATVLNAREANRAAWIVAEALDPSSVSATAVAGGPRTVVVATERLLALWILAAVRRPDQLPIAHELVVSRRGREIYTCYLDADGLDGPGVAWDAGATTFAAIVALAIARGGRVMPLGVVRGVRGPDETLAPPERGELVLSPPPDAPLGPDIRALVAIADHFDPVRDLALELVAGAASTAAPAAAEPPPALQPLPAARRHRRVLVCGFRPATVELCASLLAEDEACEVTLVQRHEESVRLAAQAFLEHAPGDPRHALASAGRPARGRFEPASEDTFGWRPEDAGEPRVAMTPRLAIVRADWSSDRTLRGLEPRVEHVARYDLVVLPGSHQPEYDGRTAMAVLKIADLVRAEPQRFAPDFTVVAGVADHELGRRLEESFARAAGRPLRVVMTEELRALTVFQAISVPGFAGIFEEVIGPRGQGFVQFRVAAPTPGRAWTFGALASSLAASRTLLIAVDLRDGRRVHASAERFDEDAIVTLWTLHDEAVTARGLTASAPA
ncbi:MAG: hypothetical protein IT385_26835, partial [Deltaproteobacteria bacterium]|nr:hypothetical protein [Deltaproteobacteria bacterium]